MNEIISSYATPEKSGKGKKIVLSFPEVEKIETNLTCSAFNVRPSPIISWGWKFAGRGDGRLKTIKTDRPETPQVSLVTYFVNLSLMIHDHTVNNCILIIYLLVTFYSKALLSNYNFI